MINYCSMNPNILAPHYLGHGPSCELLQIGIGMRWQHLAMGVDADSFALSWDSFCCSKTVAQHGLNIRHGGWMDSSGILILVSCWMLKNLGLIRAVASWDSDGLLMRLAQIVIHILLNAVWWCIMLIQWRCKTNTNLTITATSKWVRSKMYPLIARFRKEHDGQSWGLGVPKFQTNPCMEWKLLRWDCAWWFEHVLAGFNIWHL